ncbi:MAG: MgtC/SapB family protein [Pirellulaceae bacterium]|nr:MgtC/SapB family protein [Pirellulaceae bacterium]
MENLWSGVAADFQDLPDAAEAIRMSVRLIIAAVLGGLLGYNRERAGKSAGLRTHMLVALGAALFVLIPEQAGQSATDISHVIQGVVAGVGFLGAGSIVKKSSEEDVDGLTTAAGIWLTAAVGIAAGLGREASATLGAVLAFLILSMLTHLSHYAKRNTPKAPSESSDGQHTDTK